jgi:predicted transposase YbfD/YdcC
MADTRACDGGTLDRDQIDTDVIGSLLRSLLVVSETRKNRGKRYPLVDVLAIAVLGCVCGCDNAEALEDWAKKEQDWLSGFLALPHGTPGQDVFLRVLAAICPEEFRRAFLLWSQQILKALGVDGQIAVDGQTNRGSRDRAAQRSPVHMVSALACGEGLVLGQVKTDEKSNEITAIPQLLRLLDLRGALVSIDAMGCQVSIASLIRARHGDYLMGLKGNQSTLRDETEAVFEAVKAPPCANVDEAQPPAVAEATDVDKGHGRIETRTAKVITDFADWVPASERWPDIRSLIAIESTREEVISGTSTTETRFYISSRRMSPQEAIVAVRKHWLVENQLHWCLDVSFGQDANQTRTKYAAENLAVVRHFALNLVRRYKGDRYSVPRRRRLCDYRVNYREKLLQMSPQN